MAERKPIRVFYSTLSCRFYATRHYRIDDRGFVVVTGEKFDVTNDIGGLIKQHDITFTAEEPITQPPAQERRE
jgi:hypothetical protein